MGVNQSNITNNQFDSTYALLIRSKEKGRGVLEPLVYLVFIFVVVLSIRQLAETPLKISAPSFEPCIACDTLLRSLPFREPQNLVVLGEYDTREKADSGIEVNSISYLDSVACLVPARQATPVDPVKALRAA